MLLGLFMRLVCAGLNAFAQSVCTTAAFFVHFLVDFHRAYAAD
jgi:hypothetical protein